MTNVQLPGRGEIRIEWRRGHDPEDFDAYAWGVQCDPLLPDGERATGSPETPG